MKESMVYLNYFKKYLIVALLPAVLFASLGLYLQLQKPVRYTLSELIEVKYDQSEINQKVTMTDELVSLIRSEILRDKLGIGSSIRVYKSGPLSIRVDLESTKADQLGPDLERVNNFFSSKIDAEFIGTSGGLIIPNIYLGIMYGFSAGLMIGIFSSLVIEYLRRY